MTYRRVLYGVRESHSAPYRAEFYAVSNRLLKTCVYGKFEKMLGKLRPTQLVMTDALHQGENSVLDYSERKWRDMTDKGGTKEEGKKQEGEEGRTKEDGGRNGEGGAGER